jgi:hypothetical protein
VVKISAQSEQFSLLVLKVRDIINFGILNLLLDIWIRIRNTDPDPGFRPKLNADPAGSGSETLPLLSHLVILSPD